jgi:hypothetical protein
MPAAVRYVILIAEVICDNKVEFRIFDGMGAKIKFDEFVIEVGKRRDSSGKPVRVRMWEATGGKDDAII